MLRVHIECKYVNKNELRAGGLFEIKRSFYYLAHYNIIFLE